MSTIDNNNSLNSILDKLGIQQKTADSGPKDALGQAEFLKLMTTQLQKLSLSKRILWARFIGSLLNTQLVQNGIQ